MARNRRPSRLQRRNRAIGAAVVAAVVVGGIVLVARSRAAQRVTFERAMLDARPGDGSLFFMWLVLWRARLVDEPLVLEDITANEQTLMRGFARAGLTPTSSGDSRALQRALCTRYKERLLDGTLRDLPSDYSEALARHADTLLAQWEQQCLTVGINTRAASSLPGA